MRKNYDKTQNKHKKSKRVLVWFTTLTLSIAILVGGLIGAYKWSPKFKTWVDYTLRQQTTVDEQQNELYILTNQRDTAISERDEYYEQLQNALANSDTAEIERLTLLVSALQSRIDSLNQILINNNLQYSYSVSNDRILNITTEDIVNGYVIDIYRKDIVTGESELYESMNILSFSSIGCSSFSTNSPDFLIYQNILKNSTISNVPNVLNMLMQGYYNSDWNVYSNSLMHGDNSSGLFVLYTQIENTICEPFIVNVNSSNGLYKEVKRPSPFSWLVGTTPDMSYFGVSYMNLAGEIVDVTNDFSVVLPDDFNSMSSGWISAKITNGSISFSYQFMYHLDLLIQGQIFTTSEASFDEITVNNSTINVRHGASVDRNLPVTFISATSFSFNYNSVTYTCTLDGISLICSDGTNIFTLVPLQ